MPSKKTIARAYDDHLGHNWRATKNEKHRKRTRWIRETIGSDQSIARARRRNR